MHPAYLFLSLFSLIYIATGVGLFLRSKTAIISARSAILLWIFHASNCVETIFMLFLIYPAALKLGPSEEKTLWLINAVIGVSHYGVFFPYILRAYRLRLIFSLEESLENYLFSDNYTRTTQKWLIKAFFLLILPVVLIYSLITLLIYSNVISTITNPYAAGFESSPYICIVIFVRFLEHLSLVLSSFSIRHIEDDFKMSAELGFVAFVGFLTPLGSLIVNVDNQLYWIYIVKNLLMLSASSIYPVVLSFFRSVHYQILTVEMLESLDLLILHPKALDYFELFLRCFEQQGIQEEICNPFGYLDLVMHIDCFFETKKRRLKEKIVKMAEKMQILVRESGEDEEMEKIRSSAMGELKRNYFGCFQSSKYMQILKKQAFRHQLYQIKLNYSSLNRPGDKLWFKSEDWPI
jgi:hypothetical protein